MVITPAFRCASHATSVNAYELSVFHNMFLHVYYMHNQVNVVRLVLNIALNAALKCRPSVTTVAASLVHHFPLQEFAQHAAKKDPSETFCSFD